MKISCKFGEPSWCSFPLRALTPKISLRAPAAAEVTAQRTLNQSINQMLQMPIIKEVYGLTVLYKHIYAVKGTILSHFSRPKVTLKNIAKLDAGTP